MQLHYKPETDFGIYFKVVNEDFEGYRDIERFLDEKIISGVIYNYKSVFDTTEICYVLVSFYEGSYDL